MAKGLLGPNRERAESGAVPPRWHPPSAGRTRERRARGARGQGDAPSRLNNSWGGCSSPGLARGARRQRAGNGTPGACAGQRRGRPQGGSDGGSGCPSVTPSPPLPWHRPWSLLGSPAQCQHPPWCSSGVAPTIVPVTAHPSAHHHPSQCPPPSIPVLTHPIFCHHPNAHPSRCPPIPLSTSILVPTTTPVPTHPGGHHHTRANTSW